MSDDSVYEDEMGRFLRMSDRDVDCLLGGQTPEGDEALEELAAFAREVKATHVQAPTGSTEALQLAAITEAAQLLSDKGEPVVRPASKATGPDRQASGLPTWRRRLVFTQLATLWAKVVAVSAAAVMATGGLAVAGALPDPVQGVVADAAEQIGVSLDNPDNAGQPSTGPTGTVVPTGTGTDVPTGPTGPTGTVVPTGPTGTDVPAPPTGSPAAPGDEPDGPNNQAGTNEPDGANNQAGTNEPDGANNQDPPTSSTPPAAPSGQPSSGPPAPTPPAGTSGESGDVQNGQSGE